MKTSTLSIHFSLVASLVISFTAIASVNSQKLYPANVNCQLSIDARLDSNVDSIEDVARSCNEFTVHNELEFSLVKRACILGGSLTGLMHAFGDGLCHSPNAAALCRVRIQTTELEEVTWYFEPKTAKSSKPSHEKEFRKSCNDLGGRYESLKYSLDYGNRTSP